MRRLISIRASAASVLFCAALTTMGQSFGATVIINKTNFLSIPGQRVAASFEDVPVNQSAPFTSGGVTFPTLVTARNQFAGTSHQTIFGANATPPNFIEVLGVAPGLGLTATFPTDVGGAGFDLSCTACDVLPNNSILDWSTYGPQGNPVESGSIIVDFSGAVLGVPRFFGVVTDRPFRTLVVTKRSIAGGYFVWLADDIRSVPAPAIEVPTLNFWATTAMAVALVLAGYTSYRRRQI